MIKKHSSNVVILFSSLIGLSSVVVDGAFAQAWILQECGSKYQELKAAGELAGKNWQDFLKDCSTQLRLHSKYIIPEDIKKGAPKHQHDPENKDGKAKGSVEPMPYYMRPYKDLTEEEKRKFNEHYYNSTSPKSRSSASTPQSGPAPATPDRSIIPREDYERGSIGAGRFAL